MSGVSGGLLLLARDVGAAPELIAAWPKGNLADAGLLAAAQLAIKEGRGVVQPILAANSAPKLRAAYPVQVDSSVAGVVALDVEQGETAIHAT